MSESRLFSADLPLLRGGEVVDSQNNQENNNETDETNSICEDETIIENDNFDNNVDENDQEIVSEMRSKPSVMEWLEIYQRIPDSAIEELFERFCLNRENEELSWLKLYDYLNTKELCQIFDFYSVKRCVTLNLSENTDEEFTQNNLFDTETNTQSLPFSSGIETQVRFATINRVPNRVSTRIPIHTYSRNTIPSVTQISSIPAAPNNNTFSTFTSNSRDDSELLERINRFQSRLNRRNSLQNTITTQSNTFTNMRTNTNTVYSTVRNPRVSNIHINSTPHSVANGFRRYTARIPQTSAATRCAGTNIASNANSGDMLIDALENLSLNTNQTHKPPFFKYDSDPKIWLKKYEKSALLNGWRDSHKVKNFAKFVSDDVLNWITETFNSLEYIDWNTFKNEFLTEFHAKDRGITNRMKLNTLKQESDESVRAYLRRGLDLIESVSENMDEQEKVEILTFGLKLEIRDKVFNLGVWPIPGGLRDFKQMTINAENFLEINRVIASNQGSTVAGKPPLNPSGPKRIFNTNNLRFKPNSKGFAPKYPQNNRQNQSQSNYNQNYPQRGFSQNREQAHFEQRQEHPFKYYCFACGSPHHKIAECPVRQTQKNVFKNIETKPENMPQMNFNKTQNHNKNFKYYKSDERPNNNYKSYQKPQTGPIPNQFYVPTPNFQSLDNNGQDQNRNEKKPKVIRVLKSTQTNTEFHDQVGQTKPEDVPGDLNGNPRP